MKNYSITGLLVAIGCLASCATPFGEAPGPDGGPGQTNGDIGSDGGVVKLDGGVVDPGPTFSFADQNPIYVQQGQTTNVPITITRSITPGTDIKIDITSVPDGVTVDPLTLTIPTGLSTGQLAITVDKSIAQGALSNVVVLQGTAAGASAKIATNLQLFVISGKPGTLDTDFAHSGIYEHPLDYNHIYAATPQSDGKILIYAANTYQATDQSTRTSAVIRLKADGSVDSTLADPTIQKISGSLWGMTADADGRIITSMGIWAGDQGGTAINRYNANGTLDPTFNTIRAVNTFSSHPIPDGWSAFYSYAIAVGQNDSIYSGGIAIASPSDPYALLQIPVNGQPADGQSMLGCSGSWNDANFFEQAITNLSLLPDGTLAFAGFGKTPNGDIGVGVGRYTQPPSSCDLDPNYGINGTWYSTDWTNLYDAFFETDGSVDLLVGKSDTSANSLVHIEPDGQQTVKVDLPLDGGSSGITRAPDGRYLVAGAQSSQDGLLMAVAYYNSDWTPDMSIGNQGIVTIPVPTALTSPTGTGLRAVYTPDGSRTVVVGSISGANAAGDAVEHLVVARIWN
ncbi:MAG: hypothetical protein FWD73_03145 [Polyangiaceae bacterium]|nr:hypothetical protein [Polyangiaceae bacterium]